MTYPRYPAYKEIGVPWLGQVPAHWEVPRLRRIAVVNPVKTETSGLPVDTEVSFVPMEAVVEGGGLVLDKSTTIAEAQAGYTYFRDGDVVVAKITPCFENGKLALAQGLTNGIAFGTTELHVIRAKEATQARFLFYIARSDRFRQMGEGEMYGAGGQKRVPAEFILNYAIALPPPAEQAAIAAYLDRETAQIDALVARLEQLVALLQEKRQALISHAVTKGLDPAAPMKESGVEWLGQVPGHWEVAGLTKYLESVADYRGRTPTKADTGTFLVTARNIKKGRIDYEASEEYVDPYEGSLLLRRGEPLIGDVLFTMEAPLGEAANVDREDIALAQRIIKFRGISCVLDNYFLKYWILSDYFQQVLSTLATGSTALGMKASKLPQLRVVIPPFAEQAALVITLDEAAKQFHQATEAAAATIDALAERRAALITAAVTGQIDVRGLV